MSRVYLGRGTSMGGPTPATHRLRLPNQTLLSAAEEKELAAAIAKGDVEARDRLIRGNLRLVVTIAGDYLGRGLDFDDLVGEGNLGLFRAAAKYDPAFGTRFGTYATYWIKHAIRQALNNTAATIRLPSYMIELLSKWRQAERALEGELGHAPGFDLVAGHLGLSESHRAMVARALQSRRFRPEGEPGEDEGPAGLAWQGAGPDEVVEWTDAARGLRARMASRLDAREREVLTLRFGLEGGEPLPLKEVARQLGVTSGWVRKIEIRAVSKLRDDEKRVARRPVLTQPSSSTYIRGREVDPSIVVPPATPVPDKPKSSTQLVTHAVDLADQVWGHRNPAELYRWVSRRNNLLRAIDAALGQRTLESEDDATCPGFSRRSAN